MAVEGAERARLEVEMALAKGRLETLNRLALMTEIEELRQEIQADIAKQEKLISELAKLSVRSFDSFRFSAAGGVPGSDSWLLLLVN